MKRDDLRAFLAEKPYDAMVLTSEISRRYATGFHSTAGAVYLSAKQAVFFTAGFGTFDQDFFGHTGIGILPDIF